MATLEQKTKARLNKVFGRKSTSIDKILAERHGYAAYKKGVKKLGGKKVATPAEYMDAKIYRFWKKDYKIQPGATGMLRAK